MDLGPVFLFDRNLADAKYAYCSTQGYGSVIDFQGTDLSKNGSGIARIGRKSCALGNNFSGGCFFLKTLETDGLPFVHPCD